MLILVLNWKLYCATRYKIKELLALPFFQEVAAVRIEEVEGDGNENPDSLAIKLRLHVEDPKKRKDKHKDNEAIQFDFHLENDQPEKVAQEMVSTALC